MRYEGEKLVLDRDAYVISWSEADGLVMCVPSDFNAEDDHPKEIEAIITVFLEMVDSGVFGDLELYQDLKKGGTLQ